MPTLPLQLLHTSIHHPCYLLNGSEAIAKGVCISLGNQDVRYAIHLFCIMYTLSMFRLNKENIVSSRMIYYRK